MIGENWFELAIIAFISIGIAVAIFRGGAANPESTGSLGRQLRALQTEVGKLTSGLAAVKKDVSGMESRVAEIDRRAATVDDIRRLENRVDEIAEAASARAATLEHVRGQVDRLYDFIVKRGMEK